ncbi:MAG: YhbY family RNA-binding protein [Treponema sp.]|nr:YhbY family RNA-binding protein [Treponema sp.]
MTELNSKQRKFLEKHAQSLQSVVIIGQNGLSSQVQNMIKETLKIHELVKISFNEFKEEKKELSKEIEQSCDATLIRIIGNKAIFYKPAENK